MLLDEDISTLIRPPPAAASAPFDGPTGAGALAGSPAVKLEVVSFHGGALPAEWDAFESLRNEPFDAAKCVR